MDSNNLNQEVEFVDKTIFEIEYKDLSSIVNYDFRNLDLIPYNDVEINN